MRSTFAGCLGFIARAVAAFFALLFVLVTIPVLLLVNVDHILFNAATYKRALLENEVYTRFPTLVADQFSLVGDFLANPCAANPLGCALDNASPELQTCLNEALGPSAYEEIGTGARSPTEAELQTAQTCLDQFPNQPPAGSEDGSSGENSAAGPMVFLNNLSPQNWQALIALLLPPEDLQPMTESTLDQVLVYLNGRADTVTLSLVNLKARLSGPAGQEAIQLLLEAQPPCTDQQLAQIASGNLGGEGQSTLICTAPGLIQAVLQAELQRQLEQAVAGIPDQAVLIKPTAAQPASGSGPLGSDPLAALQLIRLLLRFSPLLPLALLLLVTLFGVRSMKGWLRWWGIPLFITGLIVLGVGLAALPVLDWIWTHIVLAKIPAMFSTSSLVPLAHDLLHTVAGQFATWLAIEAGIVAALGLGAIIGSSFIKPRPETEAPAPTYPTGG
jgi:hypothetical protein